MFGEKQIQLIEIAEKLFAENGYPESSIRDISKAANLNSSMISYYFGSKEKLMLAIIDYRTSNLGKVINELKLECLKAHEKLSAVVDFYTEKVFEQKHFYRMIFQLQTLGKEEGLLEHFNDLRHQNYELLKGVIDEGKEDGYFKEHIDIPVMISLIAGTLNHILLNLDYYQKVESFPDTSSDYAEVLKNRTKESLMSIVNTMVLR